MEDNFKKMVKFNSKRVEDFTLWSMRFEALLELKELLSVVRCDTSTELTNTRLALQMNLMLAKARSRMLQPLDDKPLRTVLSVKKDPAKLCEKLNERYTTKSAATWLQTELHYMRYSEENVTSEYIDEIEALFQRLESMDSAVPASMKVATLLSSFGFKEDSPYGPVVSALLTLRDSDLT